jgi:hypothetical protein
MIKKRETQNDHSEQIMLLTRNEAINLRYFNVKELCHGGSIRDLFTCSNFAIIPCLIYFGRQMPRPWLLPIPSCSEIIGLFGESNQNKLLSHSDYRSLQE